MISFTDTPMTEREASQYSPLALAFLGDSVYDTLIREFLLCQANMPVSKLHTAKIKLVCAEFQSSLYDVLSENLTEKELSILKRGRNSTGNTIPKHANTMDYRRATAFECLFGYLFLTGQNDRIAHLFNNVVIKNVLPEF